MLLCCLGLFLGLMIGYMFGWPWIFIVPLAGFILGFMVDEETAKYKSEYEGKIYYFCCEHCKKTFEKNPSKFVKSSRDFVKI